MADHTVIYDAAAAQELVVAVKAKEERRAIFNAVDKLQALGEQLAPPHMKPARRRGGSWPPRAAATPGQVRLAPDIHADR